MASASARSSCWASRFSARMMPALLMSTFSAGNSAADRAAKARIAAGSSMSRVSDFMPGLAAVVSSSALLAPPGDDDLVAQLVELFGQAAANARAAAGDENGVAGEIHGELCLQEA